MRQLMIATAAAVVTLGLWAGLSRADKVEVKGLHLCCGRCETVAKGILAKVKGVSEVEADKEERTVTFTATDAKAAAAGFKALAAGGFFGTATSDGKALKVKVATPKKGGDKVDTITIKDVHVCCMSCKKAIGKLFKGSEVSYEESEGPQTAITITGKDLNAAKVIAALRKAGFNGTVAK